MSYFGEGVVEETLVMEAINTLRLRYEPFEDYLYVDATNYQTYVSYGIPLLRKEGDESIRREVYLPLLSISVLQRFPQDEVSVELGNQQVRFVARRGRRK